MDGVDIFVKVFVMVSIRVKNLHVGWVIETEWEREKGLKNLISASMPSGGYQTGARVT